MPSAKQSTKEIEGEEWEALYCYHRDMRKATEAKKKNQVRVKKRMFFGQ